MTDEEKIAGAAEILCEESRKRGVPMPLDVAARLARQLFNFWRERVEINTLPPGQAAQRMRERYDGHPHNDQPQS